ncbi:MAG: NlpC/P60 family protein [Bryobacteraceae bacterium]
MSAFDRFVGIPYLDRGRSIVGCDCYGLLWMVFRELRGIELPSHGDRYVTGADREAMARLIAGELDDWHEVEASQETAFDGVLMREGKFPRHIGIVTAPGMVLHVQRGETSRIERYRSGFFIHRVVGFYRYRNHE